MNFRLTLANAVLAFMSMGCQQVKMFVQEPMAVFLNNQAVEKLQDEKEAPPQEQILEALEIDPEKYQLHSNLGITFNRIKKNDESEKSFKEALKLAENQKNPEGQFIASFNLGVFYGAQKKMTDALEYYQKALDINPTSNEVKTNIELLWQAQQNQSGQGNSQDQNQQNQQSSNPDDKDGQGDQDKKDKDEKDKNEGKDRAQSPKYKPRPFKAGDLSEADAKKMLEELGRQDKRIRSQFNNRQNQNSKEENNEKDW